MRPLAERKGKTRVTVRSLTSNSGCGRPSASSKPDASSDFHSELHGFGLWSAGHRLSPTVRRLPLSGYGAAAFVGDGLLVLSVAHVGTQKHLLIVLQIADFPAIVADESGVPFFNKAQRFVVVDELSGVDDFNPKAHFCLLDSLVCY